MLSLITLSLLAGINLTPFSFENIHEYEGAPLRSRRDSESIIPDSYIIVLKDHVTESAFASHRSWVQELHLKNENERAELRKTRSQLPISDSADHVFKGIECIYDIGRFKGYAGHFDPSVIEQIRRHPDAASTEEQSLTTARNPFAKMGKFKKSS